MREIRQSGSGGGATFNPSLLPHQAALLDSLDAGGTAAEMRLRILVAAERAGLAEYVAGFDDRMIAVASTLVRK